jgi:hypothetical protein
MRPLLHGGISTRPMAAQGLALKLASTLKTRTSSLGAARPLPPSADIGLGGSPLVKLRNSALCHKREQTTHPAVIDACNVATAGRRMRAPRYPTSPSHARMAASRRPTAPDPKPAPRFTALRSLFQWAYLTQPPWVWHLPLPQQSDMIMRAVIRVARSYGPPCKGLDYMSTDPEVHLGEYMAICALANLGDDTESFLQKLHSQNPDDDFPAALLDPDGRRGRPPPH